MYCKAKYHVLFKFKELSVIVAIRQHLRTFLFLSKLFFLKNVLKMIKSHHLFLDNLGGPSQTARPACNAAVPLSK